MGAGLIGTMIGVFVFLLLLLLAVQVLFDLYATTTVTSAAFDAARVAAGSGVEQVDRQAVAEDRVRSLLGGYGRDRVRSVEVLPDPDAVVLRVVADNPSFLPASMRRPLGLDTVDRTVRVRTERER